MPFLSKMISFWNNFFRRRQVERDLNDELQAYLEEMAERKMQAGFAPEAAREAALLELGGIDRVKDLVRQQRVGVNNLRSAGVTGLVAIVAFVSGASAAIGAMRWSAPVPLEPKVVSTLAKTSPQRKPSPVMEGRLVDKASGEPLPYVEIGMQPFPTFRRYTYTDGDGRFTFNNPPSQGYRLEAGEQKWGISGVGIFADRRLDPVTERDDFNLYIPTDVFVRSKAGTLLEGERKQLIGRVEENSQGEVTRNRVYEYRLFHYATSVIELRAARLASGKRAAAFGFGTPTVAVTQEISSEPLH